MSKFYEHEIDESIKQRRLRMDKALQQTTIPTLSEQAILHLLEINEQGLPDCYESFDDFTDDFWPDFSWNSDSIDEIRAVLDDSRFKSIIPTLNAKWGIDIVQILSDGLREAIQYSN